MLAASSPLGDGGMQQGQQGSPVCEIPDSMLFLHAYRRASQHFCLPCSTDICLNRAAQDLPYDDNLFLLDKAMVSQWISAA